MSPDRFITLARPMRHEIEIKRSRFITCLFPVRTSDEARQKLAGIRKEFHDAQHCPHAYLLGPGRRKAHSSDGGEPSGTAGMPILQALTTHRPADNEQLISDVLAVVVRYFGGIKLGSGGLTRAYDGAVLRHYPPHLYS